MIPILYEADETMFDHNGIGRLSDCITCEVTEERNGEYELELVYPVVGNHSESLDLGRIILSKTNCKNDKTQPFEIVSVVKNMKNVITVYAVHVSYRMSYIPVKNISNSSRINCNAAINLIKSNIVGLNQFTIKTDTAGSAVFSTDVPYSLKSLLFGVEGSLLDCYGGTWEFDRWTATLKSQRGENTDITIRYGKDLDELTYGGSREDTYTGVLPYWKGSYTPSGGQDPVEVVVIPDQPVVTSFSNKFSYQRNIVIDVSSDFESDEFENYPTKNQVLDKGKEFVKSNVTGSEDVYVEISFVQSKMKDDNETSVSRGGLGLCDEITVIHNPFNLAVTGKIVKTVYDVLLERYKSVEIGLTKPSIIDYMGD